MLDGMVECYCSLRRRRIYDQLGRSTSHKTLQHETPVNTGVRLTLTLFQSILISPLPVGPTAVATSCPPPKTVAPPSGTSRPSPASVLSSSRPQSTSLSFTPRIITCSSARSSKTTPIWLMSRRRTQSNTAYPRNLWTSTPTLNRKPPALSSPSRATTSSPAHQRATLTSLKPRLERSFIAQSCPQVSSL